MGYGVRLVRPKMIMAGAVLTTALALVAAPGFAAFVDTSMRLGNHCSAVMFPSYKGARWELGVSVSEVIEVSVPMTH